MKTPIWACMAIIWLCINAIPGPVYAREEPVSSAATTAKQTLDAAKQDLIRRHSNKHVLEQVAYDKTIKDTEGNQTHMHFDGSLLPESQWRIISITGKSLAEVNLPIPFILTPEIIEKLSLTLYEEEQQYWVFKGDMNIYSSASEENFDEYLSAFVRIDKSTKQFCNIAFVNLEDFKPASLATITRFIIDAQYEPVAVDGPLIATESKLEISGSYGFFYKFAEGISQHIDNIEAASQH